MAEDRRDKARRSAVVWKIVDTVVQNPSVTLTRETLRDWLQVPADAADRILQHLVSSGLVREIERGVWVRV